MVRTRKRRRPTQWRARSRRFAATGTGSRHLGVSSYMSCSGHRGTGRPRSWRPESSAPPLRCTCPRSTGTSTSSSAWASCPTPTPGTVQPPITSLRWPTGTSSAAHAVTCWKSLTPCSPDWPGRPALGTASRSTRSTLPSWGGAGGVPNLGDPTPDPRLLCASHCSARIAASSERRSRTTGPVTVTSALVMVPLNGNGARYPGPTAGPHS